jgi:NitT/TauT family transport system permease protein
MINVQYLLLCAGASLLRMVAAYFVSVATALVVGTAMARSRGVERVLLPLLDILQSIPILGFFPAALAFFVSALPPGLGAEAAAVFLIVTSQVWNLIFGVYASVKSLESQLFDMAKVYRLGRAATFFYVCAPASRNSLVANTLISWAGGWFFLTSSEIIALGSAEYRLTGIGTFIIESFERGDTLSFYAGVATLLGVILATYVFLLNPAGEEVLERELLSLHATYAAWRGFISTVWRALANALVSVEGKLRLPPLAAKLAAAAAVALLALAAIRGAPRAQPFDLSGLLPLLVEVAEQLPVSIARVAFVVSVSAVISLAAAYVSYTRAEVAALVALAGEALASIPALIWWPLLSAVALGSPLGPHIVAFIVLLQGALWYLYFNLLVYGLASLRRELDEMASLYRIRGWWYVRAVFAPSLLPSLAAGALSAWGGAWNATIAAEYATFGDRVIDLGGVGALMAKKAAAGDAIGVAVSALLLSLAIVAVNKTVWRKLFELVESRYGGTE